MLKLLCAIILCVVLVFQTSAFAAEDFPEVDPGITPDNILYTADILFEDLQLAFTFDSEKDANLLIAFAQERLAEAKAMTEQEKTEFVQAAIADYTAKLTEAQEKVIEVVTDESTAEEVKDELTEDLEQAAEVEEEIIENLEEEQVEELDEQTEEVVYNANVVKGIDVQVVKALRQEGLGFGQIAQVVLLSEMSGKTVDEVGALFTVEKKGFGTVAKELGIHPSQVKGKRLSKIDVPQETDEDEAAEEPTDDATEGEAADDPAGEVPEDVAAEELVDETAEDEVVENPVDEEEVTTLSAANAEIEVKTYEANNGYKKAPDTKAVKAPKGQEKKTVQPQKVNEVKEKNQKKPLKVQDRSSKNR